MKTYLSARRLPLLLPALLAISASGQPQAPVPPPAGSDQTLVLNPFEVQADSDKSYGALNSNSLTIFNASLNHLPLTADIFDRAFMDDVGALNVEDSIQTYDAGAQYGGFAVGNAYQNQPGDHIASPELSLRGAHIAGLLTDGLQLNSGNLGQTSFGTTSNYDIERIEILDGPQSLLGSGGGAGGGINLVTKQARIGQPAFGSFGFRLDQFGTKYATFDYGASEGRTAVRLAFVDGTSDSRRENIGDRLKGGYVQVATELGSTTLSLTLQQSVDTRVSNDYITLTSTSDPTLSQYNGDHLEYLLASGQAGAAFGGILNWNNAQSWGGQWIGDNDVSESAIVKADSVWAPWLSTELEFGGANFNDDQVGAGTLNLYSPGAPSNPLPGNWTMAMPQSGTPAEDDWRPHVNKTIRFTAVVTNELFGGRAHSMTSLDADYTGNKNVIAAYTYYQADSNFNVLVNPAITANLGRTLLPTLAWTVNGGPVLYAGFNPGSQRITYNGVNYVRQLVTPWSATAPGYNIGFGAHWQAGDAIVNYTQWFGGKLDTFAGFRYIHDKVAQPGQFDNEVHKPDFSGGFDYHVLPWLIPYFMVSDVWVDAGGEQTAPNGTTDPDSHTIAQELGVKIGPEDGRMSGSISAYRNVAENEQVSSAAVAADITPNGLNGQLPGGTGTQLAANINTYGVTAALTATPSEHWRMRLSAGWTGGKFESGVAFGQIYNDQFHENASGQVTYADGTVVYVPPTFNSKQLTVPSTTAGAVPLTVTLLSTPGSQYYASPQPITGAILKTSNGGLALLSTPDPVHGGILTGATGLPISDYQLNTALTGVVPLGTIDADLPGNQTWGYPAYSVNFTSVYEFSEGWSKGLRAGGTILANWRQLATYYYPSTTQVSPSQEQTFYLPMRTRFDLILGYSRRFGRVLWSTQLNIDNLFNHYHVVIYPNATSGYSVLTSLTANLDQQPRSAFWTNTISF